MDGGSNETLNPMRLEELRELCDGENDLVVEVAQLFLDEIPRRVEDLSTVVALRNFAETRLVAHLVKGVSANIGADGIAALCKALEEAAVAGQPERADDLVRQIGMTLPFVVNALETAIAAP